MIQATQHQVTNSGQVMGFVTVSQPDPHSGTWAQDLPAFFSNISLSQLGMRPRSSLPPTPFAPAPLAAAAAPAAAPLAIAPSTAAAAAAAVSVTVVTDSTAAAAACSRSPVGVDVWKCGSLNV